MAGPTSTVLLRGCSVVALTGRGILQRRDVPLRIGLREAQNLVSACLAGLNSMRPHVLLLFSVYLPTPSFPLF